MILETSQGAARRSIILCADDYAMTPGVGLGIEKLAEAHRLSATSALVTRPHWRDAGPPLKSLRKQIVIGLHFNLTLGAPLGRMPTLAPNGTLPAVGALLRGALTGQLAASEIADELERQLDAFEGVAGMPPEMIDGHQHVHALPRVREAFLKTLTRRFPSDKPLLRDPSDSIPAILSRGAATSKALTLALLTRGFGARARKLGFETNLGFSGVSTFDNSVPYEREIEQNLRVTGARHLMMCHPGYPDQELSMLDPVVERRRAELDALLTMPDLPSLIWHPRRSPSDGRIIWASDDAHA